MQALTTAADSRETRGCGVLERDERRVLRQVPSEQDCVAHDQRVVFEAGLRLVRLEAAERLDLRLVLGGVHNGIHTFLAELVAQQTARESIMMLSVSAMGY